MMKEKVEGKKGKKKSKSKGKDGSRVKQGKERIHSLHTLSCVISILFSVILNFRIVLSQIPLSWDRK